MTEKEREYFRRLKRKQSYEYRQRMRAEADRVTANIIATTVVPYDPDGGRRFAELDAALREGRA